MIRVMFLAAVLAACSGEAVEGPAPLELLPVDADLVVVYGVMPMVLLGDVDGDHQLTSADVPITRALAGGAGPAEVACPQAGDWDWSGAVEEHEAVYAETLLGERGDGLFALPLAPAQHLDCLTPRPVASRGRARPGTAVPVLLLSGHDYTGIQSRDASAAVRQDEELDRLYWIDIAASASGRVVIDLVRPSPDGAAGSGSGSGSGSADEPPVLADLLPIEIDPTARDPLHLIDDGTLARGAPSPMSFYAMDANPGDAGGGDAGGHDAPPTSTPDAAPPPPPPPPPPPCPQEGAGCAFLYLGYHVASEGKPPASLFQRFRDAGCAEFRWHAADHRVRERPTRPKLDVTEVRHKGRVIYRSVRDPRTGRKLDATEAAARQAELDAAYAALVAAWEREMQRAATTRDETIAGYRRRVSEGVQDAFEVVDGHGSLKTYPYTTALSSPCGVWGTQISWATSTSSDITPRAEFVQGNYDAADHRVCTRTMLDSSCYAGYSVIANAYANNTNTASCPSPAEPGDNHPEHAGERGDFAYAATGDGFVYSDEGQRAMRALADGTPAAGSTSSYTDGGYAHCTGNSMTVANPRDSRPRHHRR
jgi:hypothetical protein